MRTAGAAAVIRLRVAPRFHLPPEWTARLGVDAGPSDRATGAAVGAVRAPGTAEATTAAVSDEWRAPTAAEIAEWVADAGDAADELGPDVVALLRLPAHLHRRALPSGDPESDPSSAIDGFAGLATDILDLLRFKRLPLPDACRTELVASAPGRRTTDLEQAGGRKAGRSPGHPPDSAPAPERLRCVINLGPEPTWLVLGRHGGEADPPRLRIRLGAAEGLWLPDRPLAVDGCTLGASRPTLLFTVRPTSRGTT